MDCCAQQQQNACVVRHQRRQQQSMSRCCTSGETKKPPDSSIGEEIIRSITSHHTFTHSFSSANRPSMVTKTMTTSLDAKAAASGSASPSQSQDPVTMAAYTHLVKQLPTMVHPSWRLACRSLLLLLALVATSILALTKLPWYLMPIGWLCSGITAAWAFIIGQDCAHRNFTPSNEFNKVIGELCFLFMGQPYELFRVTHVYPYQHTPIATWLAAADTTTQIEPRAGFSSIPNPPFPILQSIKMALEERFQYTVPDDKKHKIEISMALSHVFLLIFLPTLIYTTGIRGLCYWLLPLLACHLVYPLWTTFVSGVIRILPSDVAISIPSYHLAQLAYQLEHYIDGTFMNVEQVIKYYISRIDWLHASILLTTPVIGLIGVCLVSLHAYTALFTCMYCFFTGLGITAGYHRLWAHRAYDASLPVRIFLMLGGSGAFEGSIKWWCGGHRVHHRYTDTPKDPYNAQGGFFYAHIGWMLIKPDPAHQGKADIRDLRADPLIQFQHKYYLLIAPFMAFILPTLVCGLGWGDWRGGFIYASIWRTILVHHSTFCVNSVAHWLGEHTYDDIRSPRDHLFTALLTFGEGYHNFHHEFPNDYRNGIRWYDYDPTKWLILFFNKCGLASNLKTFSANEIARGRTTMTEKKLHVAMEKLEEEKKELRYPPSIESLPQMTWETFVAACNKHGYQWMVIQGLVHDVSSFIQDHPGGIPFIKSAIGQDGTSIFRGKTGIYKHSQAAHNLLSNLRIAKIGEKDEYVMRASTTSTSVIETVTASECNVVDDVIKKEQ